MTGGAGESFPCSAIRYILGVTGRSVMGPNPTTEVDVLLATHGWWPWLLAYFFIFILIAAVVVYYVRRRRATP